MNLNSLLKSINPSWKQPKVINFMILCSHNMRKFLWILILIINSVTLSLAQSNNRSKKVAVYVTGSVDESYKIVIGSKMVSQITISSNYVAVERTADFLSALSKEQNYQYSGAVSDDQIVRIGQQLGVDYVAVANATELMGAIFIVARMIDVESGLICSSTESNRTVDNIDTLVAFSEDIALGLINGMETSFLSKYNLNDARVLGPYRKVQHFYFEDIPEGFHIASKEEIVKLIKVYRQLGKSVLFPIGAQIEKKSVEEKYDGITKTKTYTFQGFIFDSIESEPRAMEYSTVALISVDIGDPVENAILRREFDNDSDGYLDNRQPDLFFYVYLLKNY